MRCELWNLDFKIKDLVGLKYVLSMEATNLEILLINLVLNKPKYLQIFLMNGDEKHAWNK